MKIQVNNQPVSMCIGHLTLYLHLPGCHSLKEKRSVIKSLIAKTQRSFQVAASEVGFHERWQESMIVFVSVSNDGQHTQSLLHKLNDFIEETYPQLVILGQYIELL